MKIIESKKSQGKDYNKNKLKRYWKTIYPKKYVDKLVAFFNKPIKVANKNNSPIQTNLSGELKSTSDGFVYIDVDDSIIESYLPVIDSNDAQKPPYNRKEYNKVGAHISVMSPPESEEETIDELGEKIDFYINGLYEVEPASWDDVSKVWFVEVDCPRIYEIRKKHGLTQKPGGNKPHITVAVSFKKG